MARSAWEERLKGMKPTPEPKPQSGDGKRQVVFKVTSHIKTKAGVGAAADYIASNGGEAKKVAFDQDGRVLKDHEIHEYLDEWDLLSNTENLSAKAKAASAAERAAMNYKERFRNVQATSMMLSFPVTHDQVSNETLHKIAQEYLEPLALEGHRAIYAIHRHQGHPHIHFIVESMGDKGRLRLTKTQLKSMREWGAEISRRHNIKAYAHSRESRENVVERIQQGKEDLRQQKTIWQKEQGEKTKQTGRPLLERQVPSWYERHGVEYEARRARVEPDGAILPKPVKLPSLSANANKEINERFSKVFEEPGKARNAFLEMVAENKKTAFWYVNNRPEVFGHVKGEELRAWLSDRHTKISEQWRAEARKRIQEHLVDRPRGEFEKNRTFADMFRAKADERLQTRNYEFQQSQLKTVMGENWRSDILVDRPKGTTHTLKDVPTPDKTTKGFSISGAYRMLVDRVKIDKSKQPEHKDINMDAPVKAAPEVKPQAQAEDQAVKKSADRIYKNIEQGRGARKGRGVDANHPSRSKTRGRTREE